MDLLKLWDQTNQIVRLRFRDGEVIDARILATDPPGRADLTYEVVQIHRVGDPRPLGTTIGATVVASTDDLLDWQPIPE